MEKHESVPVNYLRQVADQLADLGAGVESWLARQGLREADLSNASVTIPVETFGALVADAVTQTLSLIHISEPTRHRP